MIAKEFLNKLITDSTAYTLTPEDKKVIQFEGVEKYIYKKLNNGKYRASKTTQDYDKTVIEKIAYCVDNNLPIHVDLSTGATKNPRVLTAPGIDWAEVFNVALLREYLKPISAGYKNGAVLEYFSVAVFENKVNYIPQQDVDLYDTQFDRLINIFNQYVPENLAIKYSRLTDRGDAQKLLEAIDVDIEHRRRTWEELSAEERKEKLIRAERNIKWIGTETNREELIFLSALAHDSFVGECWVEIAKPIWVEEDDISLGHRNTDGWAIHVRSAQASTVNFWSGQGILRAKGDSFITDILSPTQFEKTKKATRNENVDFFAKDGVLGEKLSSVPIS